MIEKSDKDDREFFVYKNVRIERSRIKTLFEGDYKPDTMPSGKVRLAAGEKHKIRFGYFDSVEDAEKFLTLAKLWA